MRFRKDIIIYKGKTSTVYINQCHAPRRKTNIYAIRKNSKTGLAELLGIIKWHGAWRQYVFFPDNDTMWNSSCLCNIQKFLDEINKKHKKRLKNGQL